MGSNATAGSPSDDDGWDDWGDGTIPAPTPATAAVPPTKARPSGRPASPPPFAAQEPASPWGGWSSWGSSLLSTAEKFGSTITKTASNSIEKVYQVLDPEFKGSDTLPTKPPTRPSSPSQSAAAVTENRGSGPNEQTPGEQESPIQSAADKQSQIGATDLVFSTIDRTFDFASDLLGNAVVTGYNAVSQETARLSKKVREISQDPSKGRDLAGNVAAQGLGALEYLGKRTIGVLSDAASLGNRHVGPNSGSDDGNSEAHHTGTDATGIHSESTSTPPESSNVPLSKQRAPSATDLLAFSATPQKTEAPDSDNVPPSADFRSPFSSSGGAQLPVASKSDIPASTVPASVLVTQSPMAAPESNTNNSASTTAYGETDSFDIVFDDVCGSDHLATLESMEADLMLKVSSSSVFKNAAFLKVAEALEKNCADFESYLVNIDEPASEFDQDSMLENLKKTFKELGFLEDAAENSVATVKAVFQDCSRDSLCSADQYKVLLARLASAFCLQLLELSEMYLMQSSELKQDSNTFDAKSVHEKVLCLCKLQTRSLQAAASTLIKCHQDFASDDKASIIDSALGKVQDALALPTAAIKLVLTKLLEAK